MKKTSVSLLLAAALAAFSGPLAASLNATDSHGNTIHLMQPASRVVTLAPHATEMVAAAGGLEKIIGTIQDGDYHGTHHVIPKMGNAWHIDRERLASVAPDLIVGWLQPPLAGFEPLLETLHVPVFFSAPTQLEQIPEQIEALGLLMGTDEAANATAAQWRKRLDQLKSQQIRRQPVLDVFVEIGREPLYTLNQEHVIDDLLQLCGGRNIYAQAPVVAPQPSLEDILRRQPDVIIVAQRPDAKALSSAVSDWQRMAPVLPAAQTPILIDPDWLVRPGPRLLDGAEALCQALDTRRANQP